MKRHLLLLATLALPALAAAGPATSFADAAKRHRSGDTAAAMAFWVPLAQQGDANAAFNLGTIHQYGAMYLNGEGTAKDEKQGWRWINEHRVAHLHHDHHPQMVAWRAQAAKLIDERDRREAFAASRRSSAQVMADLKRRSGSPAAVQLAAGREAPANN